MIGVRRVDREFRRKTGLKLIQHRQFIRTRIAVHDENRLFRPTFGNSAPQFGGDFFPADDALVQGVRDYNERILLHEINGASEGIRTLDTHVGNVMLYQAELRSLPKGSQKLREFSSNASPVFGSKTAERLSINCDNKSLVIGSKRLKNNTTTLSCIGMGFYGKNGWAKPMKTKIDVEDLRLNYNPEQPQERFKAAGVEAALVENVSDRLPS